MDNIKKVPELIKDLGTRFPTENSKERRRYGLFKCSFCGNEFEARTEHIKSGKQKSCGCLKRDRDNSHLIKHGLRKHRLYSIWNDMMKRCYNPKRPEYISYGGRGISVCERWHNITNFIEDMFPSFIEGLTLDRINVDGNYEPDNCRWVDRSTQAQNTRRLRSTNTSGYRGVNWNKSVGKWQVEITVNYNKKHLGYFTNPEEAARAYDQYIIDNNLAHTKNFNYI